MMQKLVNYYNTNSTFHSFVICLEYAAVCFITSYSGGMPTSKSGWAALGAGLVGALVGAFKRWAAVNVASVGVDVKK